QSLMTRLVGPSEQGQLQGANGSLNGIASMIAPMLFTQTFASAIGRFQHFGLPGAPFLLAAILLVCALFVAGVSAGQPPAAGERSTARNPAETARGTRAC